MDLERTARFYEEVLGLEPLSSVPGRHAFFRLPGAMFLLFQPESTAPSAGGPPPGARGPGRVALAVDPEEVDGGRGRLRSLGIRVEREGTGPRGGLALYFRDPAGNGVELATPDIWPLSSE